MSLYAGGESHVSGVRHGTPLYIAPEILNNGKASKAADVYSFGVMMWELAHRKTAWQQVWNRGVAHTGYLIASTSALFWAITLIYWVGFFISLIHTCIADDRGQGR